MKRAEIITFESFDRMRDSLGKIVCTSGGYDPVHPGHLSCFFDSKQYGDTLVVVVNGDAWLTNKKGKPFMDIKTRMTILSFVQGIDYIIPFEIEGDNTIIPALKKVRPHVFTKGGDRIDATSIPEWNTCKELNIEVVSGVGYDKLWSSSEFLTEWVTFHKNKESY